MAITGMDYMIYIGESVEDIWYSGYSEPAKELSGARLVLITKQMNNTNLCPRDGDTVLSVSLE
jgi:predicted metalloprotease